MTDIEKKARDYAEVQISDIDFTIDYERTCELTNHKIDFLAGAAYALGNQWRDAEKDKPEDGQECLCALRFTSHIEYCVMMFIANPKAWVKDHDDDGFTEHVIAWLPIPQYEPKGE